MELDKETYIKAMQEYISDKALEDKSLEWLTKTRELLSGSIANCERSAQEIREYTISERNGRDTASGLVKERKGALVEAIEMQAELEKVIVKRLDEEISKRLASNN